MAEALPRLDGADLPAPGGPRITDIVGAGLASLDPGLPGADEAARAALGIDAGARQLLLVLADGLGTALLEDHFGHAPTLRAFRSSIRSLHTVVPSTTAAAITAFGTGAQPGATRMVGFCVAHGGGTMNLLAFEGGPPAEQWQSVPTHFQRLAGAGVDSAVVSPASFAGSGLTRAALRGARHVAANALEQRCEAALRELRAGTPVVYLYWADIDTGATPAVSAPTSGRARWRRSTPDWRACCADCRAACARCSPPTTAW